MKKILILILLTIFGIGLYLNFGTSQSADYEEVISGTQDEDVADNEPADGTAEENTAEAPEEETAPSLSFSQPALEEAYAEAAENNEPLIIDLVVPSYYTENFIDMLSQHFGTDDIVFNRVDISVTTPELETLTVNENSDAVIIDALQISDYNSEVLPERDTDRLASAYMNLYDNGKTVYLLGNPNVHEHENLEAVLDEDSTYFTENDYYYIDNQEITVEDEYYDFDADQMTTETETQVAQNLYDYLVE